MSNNTDNLTDTPVIRSIAFVSGKGGTGKSIIASSVAYVLAHCGFKTAVLDLDLFTNGLTFFILGDIPRKPRHALSNVLMGQCEISDLKPVLIPNSFVAEKLHMFASSMKRRKSLSELQIPDEFSRVDKLHQNIRQCISYCYDAFECDFVLVDTRGGTDHTSVAAALSCDGYIMVTEADKPSWDMGRLLIDTYEECAIDISSHSERLGFIINKNVLPAEAIEAFLRREWMCPHLCTIPLDETAVKCFQEDKVPVVEEIGCKFSQKIMMLVRRLLFSEEWTDDSRIAFKSLEEDVKTYIEEDRKSEYKANRLEKTNVAMRAYAAILSLVGMSGMIFLLTRKSSDVSSDDPLVMLVVVLSTISITGVFLMSFGDPFFVHRIASLLFLKRDTSNTAHFLRDDDGGIKTETNTERESQ